MARAPFRGQRHGVAADGAPTPGEQLGHPHLEGVVGAGGPLLDVGHLDARGGVDSIRRLDEAGEEQRFERGSGVVQRDGVADGVDARRVVRLKVAGLPAERLGDVPLDAGEGVEVGHGGPQRVVVDGPRVRLDVRAGEDVSVAGTVGRGHVHTLRLEGLGHPGGAGEQIEGRPRAPRRRRWWPGRGSAGASSRCT